MSDPTRYPLVWPFGRPRRTANERKRGQFKSKRESNSWAKPVTIATAIERLQAELDRIQATNVVLSSNLQLRLDGLPRSGQSEPTDPGVCLYFTLGKVPHALPCDTYDSVAQNIAALAAHMDAARAIERHGVADVREIYSAFQALPPPKERPWRDVLGVGASERDIKVVREAYQRGRSMTHPDKGGSAEAFNEVERAWAEAQKELS